MKQYAIIGNYLKPIKTAYVPELGKTLWIKEIA